MKMDDITEVRRAKFEAAMSIAGYSCFEWQGDHYKYGDIDDMWRGFSLALDSVVVELPKSYQNHLDEDVFDADDVIEAIHAAGVRTK
jgi:hypothetical protein